MEIKKVTLKQKKKMNKTSKEKQTKIELKKREQNTKKGKRSD